MSLSNYKIRKGWEYRYIYRNGRRKANRFFILYYLETSLGYSRVGISASRKLCGAVKRNRIKRIIREIVRADDYSFLKDMSLNMVVVAREKMVGADFREAKEAFVNLVRSIES